MQSYQLAWSKSSANLNVIHLIFKIQLVYLYTYVYICSRYTVLYHCKKELIRVDVNNPLGKTWLFLPTYSFSKTALQFHDNQLTLLDLKTSISI